MIKSFHIEGLSFDNIWIDSLRISLEEIYRGWTVNVNALAYAAGMSQQEILNFLDKKGIEHSEGKTSYDAVDALKAWYLRKMRRYIRNGLTQDLEPGSADEMLFLQFCDEYRMPGHKDVRSWDDIDEFRLLQDFEAKCLNLFPPVEFKQLGSNSILERIPHSFLFHLRFKKTPKHNECRVRTILSIILCNRYHIFTAEADSNADATDYKACSPDKFKLNLPRSAYRLVLPPWQKSKRYDKERNHYSNSA